ncbi:MAG: double-strand break repair helicase AddA [Sphingomonas sp.]|uniref:double-strand break repair helicase AddA n=1 Tax=Sphingomonas sp. TaxID=28214 RepID=UPI0025FDF204|nr:double-strand break repair helicase AddA [Sphingomonas sp.]MBY0284023.1 double-strand break repair helicase AddA [Sphingomonas sp.]
MAVAEHKALPKLLGAQARASTPDEHVWLSASAGTGKTQVLAARVFRLLLRGTDPSAILCLTFTKAGAAEMAGRITARLAAWVRMRDDQLGNDLAALGESPTPELRAQARTLFAKLLDSPGGGIRISTIHGFCQGLLAGFPIEAGLVPGFRPIEGREEAVLMRETLADLLVEAERDGRLSIIDAIGALSLRLGEGGAEDFLHACARAPGALAALPSGIAPFVRRQLDLPMGDIDDLLVEACSDDEFDVDAVHRLAAANRAWGTATGGNHADIAECWIEATPAMRATMLGDLAGIGFTQAGEPRKYSPKLLAADPDYADIAIEVATRCTELLGLVQRAAYADLLARGLEAGRAYADAYAQAKRRLGVADFDDLIRATVALLEQPGMGDWVRYKLDLATEHVLVDEAQDTNPRQWRIVRALANEFFAGEGTRGDTARTLFVVGDYKQAIFGFQGTDPIFFAAAEQYFGTKAKQGRDEEADQGTRFNRLSLTHSFRSTRPVLEFVDAAVTRIDAPGLGVEDLSAHASEVPGPGSVTLWPPVTAGASDADEEEWIGDATRALATKIARQIKAWLDPADPLMLESQGRALRPEDVMILVKRRGELAALIVARLYAEGVPVAGVDRLRLNAPLAVRDLLAAIRFALQPDDDLSLASLLVSPLLGWTQDELLAASVPRATSLWRHLRAHVDAERLAPLFDLLGRADLATPYQLLEHLLSGPLDGRRKLIRRLGAEARDPIEELLSAALEFESRATPSLQAFLDWFDRGEVEIVRDPSAPLDAVRVMTVHGAKGLQAPLVLLADACVDPGSAPRSLLRWTPEEQDDPLPIFRPKAAERGGPLDEVLEQAAARELQEHWRLFYVAATRAEERLVIAGALGPRAQGVPPAASWYAAADKAFTALGVAGEGEREFHGTTLSKPIAPSKAARSDPLPPEPVPDWARAPAPVEARPPRPLAPSALGDDAVSDPPPTPALRAAAERGRLIHALLERLPAIEPTARAVAADRWLANASGVADASTRSGIIGDVLRVLDDPRFADLFGADALAEAPIAAVIEEGVVVSGTVDRLLVLPDRVRVIDFKTGRRAPATLDDVPDYHLRQMAAYVAALRVIFPDRAVGAALLYTAGPILFALPDALLAVHKPGLGAPEQSLQPDA